jgi:hypothetical protein
MIVPMATIVPDMLLRRSLVPEPTLSASRVER